MATKQKKTTNILQKLRAASEISYEKVAMRMRLAMKIADGIKAAGMTQKQFAEKMGKHPSEISKWLSGTHNFTQDTLFDISKILRIRLLDIDIENRDVPIMDDRYVSKSTNGFIQLQVKRKPWHFDISLKQDIYGDIPYGLLNSKSIFSYGKHRQHTV